MCVALVGHDRAMDWLTEAGLGLDNDILRLDHTTRRWVVVGLRLRDEIAELLAGLAAGVEQIGSSSVEGLLAKPIVDLAVGLAPEHHLAPVADRLQGAGWIHRGDAGDRGGHVFVLETRPRHRVAHVHVVDHEGVQWRNYLRLRDVLRRNADAREQYEAVKRRLTVECGDDRDAYTEGKTDVVRELLQRTD